jgi:soluble lytic murein transglycosylase-like protein
VSDALPPDTLAPILAASGGANASELVVEVVPGVVVVLGAVALAQLARLKAPGWSYRDHFEAAARLEGQDADVLHALAWRESNFRPAAVGAVNTNGTRDYGLCQINETNFAWLGLTQATAADPAANTRAAARVLKAAYARGAVSVADALSIYNAGSRSSAQGGGPRRTGDGRYVNEEYVRDVLHKLFWIRWAKLAPLKRDV